MKLSETWKLLLTNFKLIFRIDQTGTSAGATGGPYQAQAATGLDYYRGDHRSDGYYGTGREERGRYQSHYDDEADPRSAYFVPFCLLLLGK